MKKLFLLYALLLSMLSSMAQTTVYLRGDTAKVTNVTKTSTLVIENTSRTTIGPLWNTGQGKTIFKLLQISDVQNLTTQLAGFVPYTTATNNVDLNTHNITANSFLTKTVSTKALNLIGNVINNNTATSSITFDDAIAYNALNVHNFIVGGNAKLDIGTGLIRAYQNVRSDNGFSIINNSTTFNTYSASNADSGDNSIMDAKGLQVYNTPSPLGYTRYTNNAVQFNDGTYTHTIKRTTSSYTGNADYFLPNKTGAHTIATIDDLGDYLHLAAPTQSITQKPDFQAGLSIINNSTLGIGAGSNVQFLGNSYVWEMDTPDVVSGNMVFWMHGTGTARFTFLNTTAGDIIDNGGTYFTKSIGTSSQVLLGNGTLGTYSAPGSSVNNSVILQAGAAYNVAQGIITNATQAKLDLIKTGTSARTWGLYGGTASATGFSIYNTTDSKTGMYIASDGEVRFGTATNIGANGSRMYIFGGSNGANVDAQGDAALTNGDQSTFEAEAADYNTSSKSLAIRYFGSSLAFPSTILGITALDMAVLDFGVSGTNIIRSSTTNPILVGVNNAEVSRFETTGQSISGRLAITPTNGTGFVDLQNQSGRPTGVAGHMKFYRDSVGRFSIMNGIYRNTFIIPMLRDENVTFPFKFNPKLPDSTDVATANNKKLDTAVYNKSSVNVYKYGVLGDSTNSAARINAVLQFAATNKIAKVNISGGKYLLERSISVPSNIHLQIDKNAKFILNSGANSYMIQQSDIVNGNENIWIDGGYFNGNGVNQTTNITSLGNLATDYYGFGFMFHKVNGLRIEHVEIDSTRTFAILVGGNRATVRDLKVVQRYSTSTYNGDGVKFIGSNVYFSDAVLATNDDGWSITPGDNCLGYIPNQGNATNFNIDNINYVAIDTSASKKLDPNNYSTRAGRILTVRGDTLTRINITNLNGKVHYGVLNFSTAYPTLTAGGGMYDINVSNVNVKVMDNAPFIGLKGSFRFERGYAYNVNFNNIICATDYNIPMFFSTLFNVNNVNVSNTIFKTKPGVITQMWQDSLSNTQRLNITNAYVGDSTLTTSGVLLYKKQGNGTWSNSTVFKAGNIQINDVGATVTSNSAGTNAKISFNGISFNVDTAQLFPIAGDVVKNSTKGIGNYYNSKWNWNNNYQQLTGTNTNNSAITFSKNQIFSKYVSIGGSYSNTSGWGTLNNGGTTTTRPVLIFADNTNAAAGGYLGLSIGTNDLVTGTVVNDWVSRIPGTKWWWGNGSTAEMSLSGSGVLNLPQLGVSGLVGTDASHNISIITSLPSATSLVSPLLTGAGSGTTTLIYANSSTTGGNYTFAATSTSQTVATLALAQTFTNKTLTSPIINVTSDATGDMYRRNSSGVFERIPIGTNGNFLVSNGTLPVYTSLSSLTSGDFIYWNGTNYANRTLIATAPLSWNASTATMSISGTPLIQASNDLTAQTAAGNITTFTVGASNATFNISAYLEVTAVVTDVIQVQITYTDSNSAAQTISFSTLNSISDSSYNPVTIRAKNGTVITVKSNLTTGIGTITFNAGARIVQL